MDTDRLRIELTKEQQDQIKEASQLDISAVELRVEELEQRIAPVTADHIELTGWSFGASH